MNSTGPIRTAVLLAVLALLAGACRTTVEPDGGDQQAAPTGSPTAAATDAAPQTVDRLRLAGGDFGYPSPFAYVRGPGLIHALFVFDTLLWKDASGQVIPWLASDWEASEDGTEWRFTLRDDVRWHDGQPLTAEDVAFTFDYITTGPGAQTPVLHIRDVAEVEEAVAEDERTVVVRLARPYAPFEEAIAGRVPIIPKHVWEDVDDPAQLRGPEATLGSGPYRLEDADPAQGTYLFTANTSTSSAPRSCNASSSSRPTTSCWPSDAATSTPADR